MPAENSEMDKADDNVNPKPKLGDIKDHLNIVINYIENMIMETYLRIMRILDIYLS
jgi:hypothetical protein